MFMDKVDTCMLIDIGLGFYAVHHNSRSGSQTWKFCVLVLVNVFISLYVLNM